MKWGKPDIKGEVTEASHKDWIAIDSVSLGTSRAGGVEVGSGQEKRHRGQPSIGPVQISRTYDQASPGLFTQSVAGAPANVVIDFVEPPAAQDKAPQLYLQLKLRACIIASYQMSGGGGGLSESLSLSYTAINIYYTPYDETDRAETLKRAFFDLTSGKPDEWQ
jgi:type VI secretion system secreted protein Hcp